MQITLLHKRNPLMNYSPGAWKWSSESREYFNLWICLEGEGELLVNNHKVEVFPGVGLLLPPEAFVQGTKKSPGMLSNIGMHFIPESNGCELVDIAQRGVVTQLRHFPLIRNLAGYLDFLLFRSQAENREEQNRFGAAMLSVFLENVRMGPEAPVDRLIRKQAEAMRAQPERTRSSQELADAVGLSFSQFARRFYKMFEMSPHDFLLEQRVEKARGMLRESQMTVGEIAEALGYRDVGYFSRQFKQKNGLSPLAERKRFLNHE